MAGHVALIVEDEPEMAAEMIDLVRSFGHGSIHAETKADALALLDAGGFCYVLLDLQIKAERDSIRAYVAAGMSLLEEIRRRFPTRAVTDMHLVPVLVVSGHAKEHEDIVRAFQTGADDFVRKPLSVDGQDIGMKIRRCLERAGRGNDCDCDVLTLGAAADLPAPVSSGEVFWHAPDFSEIRLHGAPFLFTGDIQKGVMRILHDAAKTGDPWQSGKRVLAGAGSTDAAQKMSNLFRKHPCWGTLLLSNMRGKYRLKTE